MLSTIPVKPDDCISSSITNIPICIKSPNEFRKFSKKLDPEKNQGCMESAREKLNELNANKEKQEKTYGDLSEKESFENCNDAFANSNNDNSNVDAFDDALNKYYELKSKYNENLRKLGKNIRCIHCNQLGTTIFTIDTNEKTVRTLKAVCGCKTPCNLNIELALGSYINIFEEIEKCKEELKKVKNAIILYKNDIMFDSNKQSDTGAFTELKTNLNEIFLYLNKMYEKLYEIENKNNEEKIKDLQIDANAAISKIKEDVFDNAYENAVKIYTDELETILDERRENMYAICKVEEDIIPFGMKNYIYMYTLIQEKYLPTAFEIEITPPEIINFDTKKYEPPESVQNQNMKTVNNKTVNNKVMNK